MIETTRLSKIWGRVKANNKLSLWEKRTQRKGNVGRFLSGIRGGSFFTDLFKRGSDRTEE